MQAEYEKERQLSEATHRIDREAIQKLSDDHKMEKSRSIVVEDSQELEGVWIARPFKLLKE